MNSSPNTLLGLFAALLFFSCNESPRVVHAVEELKAGNYELLFDIGEVQIPIALSVVDSTVWRIHNGSEIITLDSLQWTGRSFHVKMPLFNTELNGSVLNDTTFSGKWTDLTRDSLYEIPFFAHLVRTSAQHISTPVQRTYDATFSPGSTDDECKAVGIFSADGNELTGTFLTESGDYRYLHGSTTGQSLHLSGFDGAHLFYFCANISGDSLTDGKFYSGKHWQEDWEGRLDADARLRDPDSLTTVADKKKEFTFTVQNASGDTVTFDKEKFIGKVSVIQIFGSWCPNCTDESVFMKGLYEKYHDAGLEIIPVAFERLEDFDAARSSVQHQFAELGLVYPPYFGGVSNKGNASRVFSALSKILSYPTAIFVDKDGVVRKVHTGFYGPGTGEHYEKHSQELDEFVRQLLAEDI